MRVCLATLVCLSVSAQAPIGWQAEEAELNGDVVRAWTMYAQAAALDPNNKKYLGKTVALRAPAMDKAKIVINQGDRLLEEIDPAIVHPFTEEDLADIERLKPPPELKPSTKRQSFNFRGPARQVIENTLKACDLDFVFDSDFNVTTAANLKLDDASCAEAIHSMEMVTGAFISPLGEKLVLVARDAQDKRREQERNVAITIPLDEPVAVQEAQEVGRNVQQLFEIQKFAIDSVRRMVLMRDRYSKVKPAQMLFQQLLQHHPQVFIEVEFMQVATQRDTSIGIDLPTMTQIVNFGGLFNSKPNIMSQFTNFITFGGGLTLFGIGVTDATVFASMTDTRAKVLQRAMMRSVDSQAATLHVGNKFPIMTQQYVGDTSQGTGDQTVYRPPPTIQFEDLGLSLKITPKVHGSEDVTLNIESEFKVLTGESLNGIPVISNRKFQGQVRLKSGEWAIAAGLATQNNTKGYTGIAGLAQTPIIGTVLRRNTFSKSSTDLLIVLKPRIINPSPEEGRELWVGTETRPLPPV